MLKALGNNLFSQSKKGSIRMFVVFLVLAETTLYLSNDMYLPVLNEMAASLSITKAQARATLTFWFIGTSCFQLFIGPIADIKGNKKVLIFGILLFTASTIFSSMTNSLNILYLSRFIQGSCVSIILVSGYSIIHESLKSEEAIGVLSIMQAVAIVAPAFGPSIGSVVVKNGGSWRNIFFILFILGLLSAIGLYFFTPKSKPKVSKIDINKLLKSYKNILTNKLVMKINFMTSLSVAGMISWITESPEIIVQTYRKTSFDYSIAQIVVFSAFIISRFIQKKLLKTQTINRVILISILIYMFSSISIVISSLFKFSIVLLTIQMTVACLGIAIGIGVLARIAIESTNYPVGISNSILSTVRSIACSITIVITSIFNFHSTLSFGFFITACSLVSFLLYLTIPNLKLRD